ncbi:hypothetical protein M569_07947, partial [Genlisea aurea]
SPPAPLLGDDDGELDRSLVRLENFLGILGFCQYSFLRAALSWIAFFVLSIALPLVVVDLSTCVGCEKLEIESFELEIILFRAAIAAVSLLCVSRNLRKYGIRKALFFDRTLGRATQFRKLYIQKIRVFYRFLLTWVGICLALKSVREIYHAIYLHNGWWLSTVLFLSSLLSWSYSTLVFLSGCALFHLVGNLQVIHFENYGKVLEQDLDVSAYIEEHMSLTYDLSKISHRFRIFLLLEFLIITACQFVTLLQTTQNVGIINLINAGDFAVLTITQLVGIVLCLNAAARISHRAQSLGSVASRWHALATCSSSSSGGNNDDGSFSGGAGNEPLPPFGLRVSYSEADLESSDFVAWPSNTQLYSTRSSYHKRQAFVTYVLSNTGGFTIFGWVVDRMLVNTIFFIELSLVFFVLGKTITVTVR